MAKEFNFFNQFMEKQKEWMEQWQDMAEKMGEKMPSLDQMPQFPGMPKMPMPNPVEAYQNYIRSFSGGPILHYKGSPEHLMGRIGSGTQVYYNLYKMYKDVYEKNIEPTEDNIKKALQDYKKYSSQFMNHFIMPYMPSETQELMGKAMEVSETFKNSFGNIFGPWADSYKELTDSFVKGYLDNPEGFLEYFNTWKENYEETFGKMLNMPMMGISRESYQNNLQTLDKYIKFVTYYVELMIKLSTIVRDSTEKVLKETLQMIKDGEEPKTFEEFYRYWQRALSRDFDKVFYSDEFSKFLGNFISSMMMLKIQMDKVFEDSLKKFPIPTNKDMDSLYKSVYELKKEVRAMKKELRQLKNEKKAEGSNK